MAKSNLVRNRINELKQELILEKAIDLFYDKGYRGTSMEMIADELGVTKPFLYYRYKSKADILSDVFARAEAIALEEMIAEMESDDPPQTKLRCIIRNFIDMALEHQKLLAVFYTEERNLPPQKLTRVREIRQKWAEGVRELLEEGKKQGVFHVSDTEIAVRCIMGMVIWSYNWYQDASKARRDNTADELTQVAMAIAGCPDNS